MLVSGRAGRIDRRASGKGTPAVVTVQTADETLTIPLDGLTEAEVQVGFGGGELIIGVADPGVLVSGTFEGGVSQTTSGPGKIALEPTASGRVLLTKGPVRWQMGLTAEIPVDLRLDSGANRTTIDLRALRLRHLELHTGASETIVQMPASGQSSAHVVCGFASVVLEVPEGVAARVRGKVSMGSTTADQVRFPPTTGGWASPDFETARDRVDISVEGGFGSVKVV
jgi:hypothetical protein